MKKEIMKKTIVGILFILATLSSPAFGDLSPQEETVLKEIQDLKTLRETDSVAYQEAIWQKKTQLQETLQNLHQRHPDQFQTFLQKEKGARQRRIEYLKKSHPDLFEHFKTQRLKHWDKMAERNPERFQQLAARHPKFKEHYERFRQHRQERARPFRSEFAKFGGRRKRHVSSR